MDKITVKKSDLLTVLKQNLEKHVKDFHETILGYQAECAELVQKNELLVTAGLYLELNSFGAVPESHSVDYARVIKMLEMDTSDVVELDAREFDQYVNDSWNWKHQFDFANSTYAGKARRK